jgi:hypothetical protein
VIFWAWHGVIPDKTTQQPASTRCKIRMHDRSPVSSTAWQPRSGNHLPCQKEDAFCSALRGWTGGMMLGGENEWTIQFLIIRINPLVHAGPRIQLILEFPAARKRGRKDRPDTGAWSGAVMQANIPLDSLENGGGEGSRTPVRDAVNDGIYTFSKRSCISE